jgi:hypothetical protein
MAAAVFYAKVQWTIMAGSSYLGHICIWTCRPLKERSKIYQETTSRKFKVPSQAIKNLTWNPS